MHETGHSQDALEVPAYHVHVELEGHLCWLVAPHLEHHPGGAHVKWVTTRRRKRASLYNHVHVELEGHLEHHPGGAHVKWVTSRRRKRARLYTWAAAYRLAKDLTAHLAGKGEAQVVNRLQASPVAV